jgi:hypothetical protein
MLLLIGVCVVSALLGAVLGIVGLAAWACHSVLNGK